jgi:hypothetical protein
MNSNEIAKRIESAGITRTYTAQCDCKDHKGQAWIRISPETLVNLVVSAKIDLDSKNAYKVINHELFNVAQKVGA